MSGMGGIGLIEEIKKLKLRPPMKVIAVTAGGLFDDSNDRMKKISRGTDGILQKPFSKKYLNQLMSELIEKSVA